MLVSASDPSVVIKLSKKESRTRSEILREADACQINACVLGTRPEHGWGGGGSGGTTYIIHMHTYVHSTWSPLDLRIQIIFNTSAVEY